MKTIGWILFILGLIDLAAFYLLDIDLTGVSWSSWVLTAVGGFLLEYSSKGEKKEEE